MTSGAATIKVEPNTVIRGTVFATSMESMRPAAAAHFAMSASARRLALADLFGGKLCAALDRKKTNIYLACWSAQMEFHLSKLSNDGAKVFFWGDTFDRATRLLRYSPAP